MGVGSVLLCYCVVCIWRFAYHSDSFLRSTIDMLYGLPGLGVLLHFIVSVKHNSTDN